MIKGEIIAETGDPNLTYDDAISKLVRFWREEKLKPYHYLRYRWWNRVDLEEVAKELGEEFSVEWSIGPRDEMGVDLRKAEKDVLKVKADTLGAYLDIYKAVLYQREAAPFTARDLKLRNKLFEIYTRDRPTPFPWMFLEEPKFTVADTSQRGARKVR